VAKVEAAPSVTDHYGPGVPIGGGALAGKDPHKVDKCGALRGRQLAKKLVRGGVDEARVLLGWTPGVIRVSRRGVDKPGKCESAGAEGRVAFGGMVQHQGNCPRIWNCQCAIGRQICGEATSAKPLLPGSDEDRCNHEESNGHGYFSK
jgi:hypothetical protein